MVNIRDPRGRCVCVSLYCGACTVVAKWHFFWAIWRNWIIMYTFVGVCYAVLEGPLCMLLLIRRVLQAFSWSWPRGQRSTLWTNQDTPPSWLQPTVDIPQPSVNSIRDVLFLTFFKQKYITIESGLCL